MVHAAAVNVSPPDCATLTRNDTSRPMTYALRQTHQSGLQTVDLIVYRPAGGVGQHKNRRLWLGGKQKAARRVEVTTSLPQPEFRGATGPCELREP